MIIAQQSISVFFFVIVTDDFSVNVFGSLNLVKSGVTIAMHC